MKAPPWTVEHAGPNVAVVRMKARNAKDWEQWFLLRSDAHHDNPHCLQDLELEHLELARERGAGVIDAGDLFCAMQGKYDKRASKSCLRPEHQVDDYLDALVRTAADFYQPFAHNFVVIADGNHECLSPDHDVLSRDGWRPIAEISESDEVAMLHPTTLELIWSRPVRTHRYEYSGEMIHISHRSSDMLVTPNHRIAYLSQGSGSLMYAEAGDLRSDGGQVFKVPASGTEDLPDADIEDDWIRLAAWLLTDGTIKSAVEIYQSKPETVERIRCLLDSLGLTYNHRVSESKTTEIMGVPLKSKPRDQHTFRLRRDELPDWLDLAKGRLPEWASRLSERQSDLFLNELILGDGSRHPSARTAMMLYGTLEFLEAVQAWGVTRGYRCMLSSRKRNGEHAYWCLNITKRAFISVHGRYATRVPYTGDVHCLTTPAGNFIARRNGKVFVTGNSAIKKRHETDLNERLVSVLNDRTGSRIQHGGYTGWVRFKWERGKQRGSVRLWYGHGWGGGGPVTSGTIQSANRMPMMVEGADIMLSGHVHEAVTVEKCRVYLNDADEVCTKAISTVISPTYKDEYGTGEGGWHIETGKAPKPLGAWWLRFYWDGSTRFGGTGTVRYELTRAD